MIQEIYAICTDYNVLSLRINKVRICGKQRMLL